MLWILVTLMVPAACQQSSGHRQLNRVSLVQATCDKDSMEIQIEMEKPFKGIVFSKDFARECSSPGKMDTKVSLHLPSNACGVRTSFLNTSSVEDETIADLYYTVTLVLQMDKYLQQSSDQEILVRCRLKPRAIQIVSSALDNVIKSKLRDILGNEVKKTRTGRNRHSWSSESVQREMALEATRAWMELAPAAPAREPAAVEVGQPTRLLVLCTLPVGVGLRVTNCLAHDGLGEASQKLLDDAGCPIDETIFTKPTIHKYRSKGTEVELSDLEPVDPMKNYDVKKPKTDQDVAHKNLMTYQRAVTNFAAFKFPDRAKLHLTCAIELCDGECPDVDCRALQRPQQTRDGLLRKARLDKDAKGIVLDRLEVYNSIDVLAPNIELEDEASIRGSRQQLEIEEEFVRGFSPGDKTICLSPGKMALAFCVLGIIFLCALAVAFVSLIRARRKLGRERMNTSLSFYTGSKSMFSSSGSSSSGLSGSKLLLTDSPYLDHHSSSSNNWPYSRPY